jgi:hypothetical protein
MITFDVHISSDVTAPAPHAVLWNCQAHLKYWGFVQVFKRIRKKHVMSFTTLKYYEKYGDGKQEL